MKQTDKSRGTLTAALATALLALALGGCYWNPAQGAGNVTLNLQTSDRSQVVSTTVAFARVYLYSDNMNTAVGVGDGAAYGGTPYFEAAMSPTGGSVTIDNVPAGAGYQVLLTLGTKTNGVFIPGEFGVSAPFAVVSNRNTAVSIASVLSVQSFLAAGGTYQYEPQLLGSNVVSVAALNSTAVAAATPSAGYVGLVGNGPLPLSYTAVSPGAGVTINSISVTPYGGGEFLFNTSNGIKEFTSSGTSVANLPAGGPTGDVLTSGIYNYGAVSGIAGLVYYYAGYYKTDSGFGGLNVLGGGWVSIDLPSVTDFALPSGLVALGVTQNGYFATAGGAFGIDAGLSTSPTNNLAYAVAKGSFFTLIKNGVSLDLESLAVSGTTSIIIGTNDGIYTAALTSVDSLVGTGGTVDLTASASPMPGTAGHSFRKVLYSSGYLVGISNNLIVYVNPNGTPYALPTQAVSVGAFQDAAILPMTTNYLLVAGSEGLTYVPLN